MNKNKVVNVFMSVVFIASLLFGGWRINNVTAMPMDPVDEAKVPHYFGPNTNWAMSPFRVPDVSVAISGGGGAGATAAATVDPQSGALLTIDVINPGSGYTFAPSVSITGSGKDAAATALVDYSGVVTGIAMDIVNGVVQGGGGYTAPAVAILGGGAVTNATATAYGGVDVAALIAGVNYGGYTMPVVEFSLPNDPAGTRATGYAMCVEAVDCASVGGGLVTVNGIGVANVGSGYSSAPTVIIRDGPADAPVSAIQNDATATLAIQNVVVDTFGTGYTSSPTVTFSDNAGSGTGASATASVSITGTGSVTGFIIENFGSGYMTKGIKKFTDQLPGLCVPPDCPTDGSKYIPLAVGQKVVYSTPSGPEAADEYEIAVIQYRTSFSSSLPSTLVRGYVELAGKAPCAAPNVELFNAPLDPLGVPVSTGYCGVTPPQYLGPIIAAEKDKPVRIIFRNLLPTDTGGNLFLPVDSSLMGSGMGPMAMADPLNQGSVMDDVRNPMCTDDPQAKDAMGMDTCFMNNRATLHLHGGTSPWISDGTVHQWITPANEMATWPQGVSVSNVPDMGASGCDAEDDGCMTFYYTNQQSARLMFYHDHSWGITRLNVYAGEAAGYLITDDTEKKLLPATVDNPTGLGLIPGAAYTIPLVIQDKTFVPEDWQMYNRYDANGKVISYGQDPTWDASRWGGYGNFWYHHVYMPAQNPGDPSGMSAYGRWMYGPWFWPPAANTVHGPIPNPYYNVDPDGVDNIRGNADDWQSLLDTPCNLDDSTTWQYETDPFCEPEFMPGTPNISVGMEQFNDTPIVNGVAYPTITLEPKAYRLRILSAANDRFFNFQWYVGDPNTASPDLNSKGEVIGATEVAFKAAELAAAQTDPNVFPTPDARPGPDWIQIGTEGGFLPAPVVLDGQQVTTWITDPTRFDVGNVDQHSLLLAPAERADVIVDFSGFEGETLILYNDAPAAFPARVPSYDYYTGAPDLSPNGAPTIVPGYGPNTRTIMQVKIAGTKDPAYNLTALQNAFKATSLGGQGVFQSSQHPIIVGQAAYNSAYGTNFAAGSNCNAPGSTVQRCDGFVRINDTSTFGFNTLFSPTTKMTLPLQPKAIHDEMNSSTFDEFGRMQANLGVEAQPPVPGAQNVVLYPFVNPATELIDATNLPKANVTYDSTTGLPVSDVEIAPLSSATDGTQLWRVTHNGVDTHPIHFHLFDVQLVNRVTWDNIIIPPDANELGWKDTVRIAPLEDTIVALRPIIPEVPWELPNAIHNLNAMMPTGSTAMFNNVDPQGNPTNPVVNQLVNFGWEYVYHCHILSHEEMDMMRPVSVVLPPIKPDGLGYTTAGTGNNARLTLNWNDNSITETTFVIQSLGASGWIDVGTILSPLDQPNIHQPRSFTVPSVYNPNAAYSYRIVAQNKVGYGSGFPTMTAQSVTDVLTIGTPPNFAPTFAPANLTPTLLAGPQIRLTWTDNATNEGWFVIERSANGGAYDKTFTAPARNNTGTVTFTDMTIPLTTANITYSYRVAAANPAGVTSYAVSAPLLVPGVPTPAPSNFTAVNGPNSGNSRSVILSWKDNTGNETGFTIQRATNAAFTSGLSTVTVGPGVGVGSIMTLTQTRLSRNTVYYYRIRANNGTIIFSTWVNATPFPITTNP